MSDVIPVLESARLRFRAFQNRDTEPYAACCSDSEVMKYLGDGSVYSVEETWQRIAFFLGHWPLRGYGMWAIECKTSGAFVGRIGFHQPHNWPGLEIGWLIRKEDWGKGFATEAAKFILPYGQNKFYLQEVISLIHPENVASIKVAQHLGGLEGESILLKGQRILKFEYDVPEM